MSLTPHQRGWHGSQEYERIMDTTCEACIADMRRIIRRVLEASESLALDDMRDRSILESRLMTALMTGDA